MPVYPIPNDLSPNLRLLLNSLRKDKEFQALLADYKTNRSKIVKSYRPWRASDDFSRDHYIFDSGVADGEARVIAYMTGENVERE